MRETPTVSLPNPSPTATPGDRDGASGPSPSDATGVEGKEASVRWLAALNFSIADVQNGMGPYVALFLQSAANWNPAQIGTALAFGNIAQVLAQTPVGVWVDQTRRKRGLLAIGIVMIALACIVTPLFPTPSIVTAGQILVGVAGAIFPTTLAALALGLVGRRRMDAQMGTNQASNAAGNVFAAIAIGAAGYFFSLSWMFFLVVALCALSLMLLWRIRPGDIDHDLARGADGQGRGSVADAGGQGVGAAVKDVLATFRELVRQRAVRVFLICAVIFHFANAAMVPLVTEMLAKNQGAKTAVLMTSGYMLASQLVFVVVAAASGRLARSWGRKPLFLFAFAALAVRGVLYTLSDKPAALIAVQCMDGLGAGVFGVVAILIVADLTQGSGRFNAAQGAVATAQGLGAFLSNSLAGLLAHLGGTRLSFLSLAAIALAGFLTFAFFMPETRDLRAHKES